MSEGLRQRAWVRFWDPHSDVDGAYQDLTRLQGEIAAQSQLSVGKPNGAASVSTESRELQEEDESFSKVSESEMYTIFHQWLWRRVPKVHTYIIVVFCCVA